MWDAPKNMAQKVKMAGSNLVYAPPEADQFE